MCASCHGDQLEGGGQSVGDLFERIQGAMPGDRPGTLARTDNADIVAYLLKENQRPAGKAELPSDATALKQIQIDKPQ